MSITVADTSALVASVDKRDRNHERCLALVSERAVDGIVVPVTVAVEVDYLLRSRTSPKVARAFATDLDAGRYILEPVDADLYATAVDLDNQFADLDLGIVDGTVIAAARRLRAEAILSLDSHYQVAAAPLPVLPDSHS